MAKKKKKKVFPRDKDGQYVIYYSIYVDGKSIPKTMGIESAGG